MLATTPNRPHTLSLTNPNSEGKPNRGGARGRRWRLSSAAAEETRRAVALAEFLPVDEGQLVREVIGAGRPLADVARLLGAPARAVEARLRRAVRRTNDPVFAFVASRRARVGERAAGGLAPWPRDWSAITRIVAELCVLGGMPSREAAARSGVSFHTVRRQLALLRALGRVWEGERVQSSRLKVQSSN